MHPPIEALFAQHVRDVALRLQRVPRGFKIASEKQGGYNGGGQHFGVRHLALWIVAMVHQFQHVITQAVSRYNLGVHRFTCKWFGFVTYQFTRNLWIFLPLIQNSNLGYLTNEPLDFIIRGATI
jgi:hypothetical protein